MQDDEVVDLQVDSHLVGEHAQDLAVGARARDVGLAEGAHAPLPVDEGAVLLHGRGHGQDDVGVLADLAAAHLELDGEAAGGQGRAGQTRVGEVAQVDAADDGAAQGPVQEGGEDPGGVTAQRRGQAVLGAHVPGPLDLGTGLGVAHGATAGQEAGQQARLDAAALAAATRDPGQVGTGGRGQGVHDAQQTGNAGGALTDEDGGAVGAQGLDEVGVGLAEVGDDAGLLTGRGEDGLGGELAAAGAQAGGHGGHLDAAGAHALAQAQEQ